MIRFCDKDVFCIGYNMLNRESILSYFLCESRSALICVVDCDGRYLGIISYESLLSYKNVFDAIQYDFVILDENIWENGRNYFKTKDSISLSNGDVVYLPVLDSERNLLYFAYQDDEANKELRMLWELLDGKGVDYLNFSDVYPEYTCVTVHGCNELAWYFVKYLISVGISVNVEGDIWKQMGTWDWQEALDYRNLQIYAEGTWPKEENMLRYMLRSVSVEFECIDRIYEANIKEGLIKNANFSFINFFERLRQEEEIVILGIDANAQDAYDLLYGYGIDICCFYSLDAKEQQYLLLGKPVMDRNQIISTLKHPVFIECETTGSTLGGGIGDLDKLAYLGLRRNDQVFFLHDYSEIPKNQLQNVLRDRKLVLAGNRLLCRRLSDFFKEHEVGKNICYIGEIDQCTDVLRKDCVCLVIEPIYYYIHGVGSWNKRKERVERFAERTSMLCYTEYFSVDSSYLEMEMNANRYLCPELRPRGILLGNIPASSGNYLMQDIMDGHPNVLKMNYVFLNNNLYFICLMLAELEPEDILPEFWNLYNSEVQCNNIQQSEFVEPDIFSKKMKEMLAKQKSFTSQELFVMFHISYAAMYGIEKVDVKETIIYFEPHFVTDRSKYAIWLNEKNIHGATLFITRNACMKAGSILKGFIMQKRAGWRCLFNSVELKKHINNCDYWEQIEVRFEDLKCKPRETISLICEKIGLQWSDTLLNATLHGEKVHHANYAEGFDLKPVYNNYEEYFSAYDRLRIFMFNYLWQKKYGYPNISCTEFSKKELQEILLKEFRFDNVYYSFPNEETQILYRLQIKREAIKVLREVRKEEIMSSLK